MSIAPARRVAFAVLRRVEAEGAYASDLLNARLDVSNAERERIRAPDATRGLAGARDRDAALATELTFGVLRWQRLLDFLLARHTRKPIEKMDVEVRLALRLGLYQLRFLTRVPARAAVDESVELVKRFGKRSAAGLVNAVLRRLAEEYVRSKGEDEQLVLPRNLALAEQLGIRWSHPTWMVERWLARLGEEKTAALLETNNQPPRLCCTLRDEGQTEEIVEELQGDGMSVEPGRWLRTSLTVHGGNPAATAAFHAGKISIQDEASAMVALLLGVQAGERVLDLCAAPGGKTLALARQVGTGGHVVAGELHRNRLAALREQLQRAGTQSASLIRLDGTAPLPFTTTFDRILVDAPCSGTGTLARNPEIRWRLRSEDLADFHARQVKLLANAARSLKRGGMLVYSTCSLEEEENEQVLEEVRKGQVDLRVVSGEEALRPHLKRGAPIRQLFDAQGLFRTVPPEHGTDGFFAAVVMRD